jgi:hypothetical protein
MPSKKSNLLNLTEILLMLTEFQDWKHALIARRIAQLLIVAESVSVQSIVVKSAQMSITRRTRANAKSRHNKSGKQKQERGV